MLGMFFTSNRPKGAKGLLLVIRVRWWMDVVQVPGTRDAELKARWFHWARFGIEVEVTEMRNIETT